MRSARARPPSWPDKRPTGCARARCDCSWPPSGRDSRRAQRTSQLIGFVAIAIHISRPAPSQGSDAGRSQREAGRDCEGRALPEPELDARSPALTRERTVRAAVARECLEQVVRAARLFCLFALLRFVTGAGQVEIDQARSHLLAENRLESASRHHHLAHSAQRREGAMDGTEVI